MRNSYDGSVLQVDVSGLMRTGEELVKHEGTLRALGLGKIGRSAEHKDSPQLQGMLRHVRHLVRVEEA